MSTRPHLQSRLLVQRRWLSLLGSVLLLSWVAGCPLTGGGNTPSGCLPSPDALPDNNDADGANGAGDGVGTDAGAPPADLPWGVVARIAIEPAAFLLSAAGESTKLTVRAFDAAGQPIRADATWRSSDDAVIRVEADGTATALSDLGSAQITAEAGGVSSPDVMGVVARPAAGATLVADQQLIDVPTPVDPAAPYGLGYRYRVTLRDLSALEVGAILIGTGEQLVAGRVVEASPAADGVRVTLEVVGLDELFEELKIERSFDLSNAPIEVPEAIAAGFDVSVRPDGTIDYTPRAESAGKVSRRAQARGSRALFDCELEPGFPIEFTTPPIISVTRDISLEFSYDSAAGGFQRCVLTGEAVTNYAFSPSLALNFAGSYKCETTLAIIPLPVLPPWLRLIIYPDIAVGLGFDVSGNVNAAQVGFELAGKAKYAAAIGVDCASGDCQMVNTATMEREPAEFKPVLPNPEQWNEQVKIGLSLQAYAWAELELSNPFLRSLKFEAFKARFGPKFTLDLAHPHAQIEDPDSSSGYKLTLAGEAGIGNGIEALKKALKIQFTEFKLTLDVPLDESPKGTFGITPDTVQAGSAESLGDMATFRTTFEYASFLGAQAIESVEYFWWKDERAERGRPLCSELPATFGQTELTCETDFLEEHAGPQKFYAFYHARLFGVPLPFPLEVANDAEASVQVQPPELDSTVSVLTTRVSAFASGRTQYCANPKVMGVGCADSDVAELGSVSAQCSFSGWEGSGAATAVGELTITRGQHEISIQMHGSGGGGASGIDPFGASAVGDVHGVVTFMVSDAPAIYRLVGSGDFITFEGAGMTPVREENFRNQEWSGALLAGSYTLHVVAIQGNDECADVPTFGGGSLDVVLTLTGVRIVDP